jgi:hypothetical protein
MTAPARRAGAVALVAIRNAAEEQGDEKQARLPRDGECPYPTLNLVNQMAAFLV